MGSLPCKCNITLEADLFLEPRTSRVQARVDLARSRASLHATDLPEVALSSRQSPTPDHASIMKSFCFFVALFAASASANHGKGDFKLLLSSLKDDCFSSNGRDELNEEGPTFTIDVSDHSLSNGVGKSVLRVLLRCTRLLLECVNSFARRFCCCYCSFTTAVAGCCSSAAAACSNMFRRDESIVRAGSCGTRLSAVAECSAACDVSSKKSLWHRWPCRLRILRVQVLWYTLLISGTAAIFDSVSVAAAVRVRFRRVVGSHRRSDRDGCCRL